MRTRVLVGVFVFWALLSWDVELHHHWLIGAGVVTALGLAVLVHRDEHLGIDDWGLGHVWRLILYVPWLTYQIVVAALRVMRLVWSPSRAIDPQMVDVPCDLETATGRVTFANSITLTPGTVTVITGPTSFLVHALTREDAEGVLDGEMLGRVRRVEQG